MSGFPSPQDPPPPAVRENTFPTSAGDISGSEEIYRTVVETTPDGIVLVQDGRIVFANRQVGEILGVPVEELQGREFARFIAPDDRDDLLVKHARMLQGDDPGRVHEIRYLDKTGKPGWALMSAAPVEWRGQPAIVAIFTDYTAQKVAEEALAASEEKFRTLVTDMPVGAFETTPDGRALLWNRMCEELSGYSFEHMQTIRMHEIYPDPAQRDAFVRAMREKGHVSNHEVTIRTADGRLLTVLVSARVGERDGEKVFRGSFEDITERKHLEEQLRQSQKMEAVGRLAGGVAHDFNNLLTVILGNVQMAFFDAELSPKLRSRLESIQKASEQAKLLTDQLLSFSRKQMIQPRIMNVNELIRESEKLLTQTLGEDITLELHPSPEECHVRFDAGQFSQVLMNLAVNARDAMPTGGRIVIETALVNLDELYAASHSDFRAGEYVQITVSDTGHGMDEAIRQLIFEPFFTTKGEGGTGLGLSTVYGILKQNGGDITVFSQPGVGTTFRIYIPRITDPTEVVADEMDTEFLPGSEHVLLVEDDRLVRQLAEEILHLAGYRVSSFGAAAEAVAFGRENLDAIDLLITDVVMPGQSGKEVADILTGLDPDLRVLYMSGYTDEAISRHGVLDQDVAFINKPFTPRLLTETIRTVLDAD